MRSLDLSVRGFMRACACACAFEERASAGMCRFRNTLMPLSVKITYINQSLDVWMATVREATDVCIDSVVSVGSILSKHLLAFWFLTAATECIGL